MTSPFSSYLNGDSPDFIQPHVNWLLRMLFAANGGRPINTLTHTHTHTQARQYNPTVTNIREAQAQEEEEVRSCPN